MNDLDELTRLERLEKLLRMTVHGRVDAAIKLAEVIEAEFVRLEAMIPAKKAAK